MLRSFVKYVILLITIQKVFSETAPAERGCLIPNTPQLQDLIFKIHPQNQTVELGSNVEEYNIINIECKENYTLKGQQSLICQNGKWNHNFPTCAVYCDGTLLSSLSLQAICDFRDRFSVCPKKISPGTKITVNCAFGYTRTPRISQLLRCLQDGSFDETPQRCKQNCGRIAPSSTVLSKNGIEIDSSVAPWHVAIYAKIGDTFDFGCSGSIVSPTVIISAAHCFWDEANLILRNNTYYHIIAGRKTKNYTTEKSLFSQVVKVQEIHIPVEYEGIERLQKGDVAFLKLETPLKYSETIAPICMPTDLKSTTSNYVSSKKDGFIYIFGAQNELEKLKMITLAYHECIEINPRVADDKFCIYNNECGLVHIGNSGGGFFIESTDPETKEITYKLLGVVSNTPNIRNDCSRTGDKQYIAITDILNADFEFRNKLNTALNEDKQSD